MLDPEELPAILRELAEAQRAISRLVPPAHEVRPGFPVAPFVLDQAWIEEWDAARARRDAAERAFHEWRVRTAAPRDHRHGHSRGPGSRGVEG